MAIARDFTAPYSVLESYLYDAIIAPAVMRLGDETIAGTLVGEVAQGASVLEVGCGGGQLAVEARRRRPDLRWTGVDLSAEQIARARRRVGPDPRCELLVGSALDLLKTVATVQQIVANSGSDESAAQQVIDIE